MNLDVSQYKILQHHFVNTDMSLLKRKGVYPSNYVFWFAKFDEKEISPASTFENCLTCEPINENKYEHAQKVWKTFKLQEFGQYNNLYLKTDILLLADVLQNYTSSCQQCLRIVGGPPHAVNFQKRYHRRCQLDLPTICKIKRPWYTWIQSKWGTQYINVLGCQKFAWLSHVEPFFSWCEKSSYPKNFSEQIILVFAVHSAIGKILKIDLE